VSAAQGSHAAGVILVPLHAAAAQPWRNGGGLTRELLAWPPASPGAPAAWTVRVSVADIASDGPFSAFPGLRRGFAVLEGAGVVLALQAGERRLAAGDDVLLFDGAEAPGCRLVDGPTRDLNLMVRGEAGTLRMQRAVAGQCWGEGLAWRGLYTHAPARLQTTAPGAGEALPLAAGTLAWSDDPLAPAWTLLEGPQAWWLGCAHGGRA
jgi:environmental stress-induced protein Ves